MTAWSQSYPGSANTMSYAYNADGQRVQLTSKSSTTKYVWDGERYLMETDGSNNPNVVYTQGDGNFGDLISQRRKSGSVWTPSYYLFDGIGSTDRVLDANQANLATYLFKAYGDQVASTGSLTNPFRFIGRWGYYLDYQGLGDYYVRARWYRSAMARWLSCDPSRFTAGVNLYRYANNRPVNYFDPSGATPLAIACAVACGAAVVCLGPGVVACAATSRSPSQFFSCMKYYWSQLPWWEQFVCGAATLGCFACALNWLIGEGQQPPPEEPRFCGGCWCPPVWDPIAVPPAPCIVIEQTLTPPCICWYLCPNQGRTPPLPGIPVWTN